MPVVPLLLLFLLPFLFLTQMLLLLELLLAEDVHGQGIFDAV
jgi:hypothetical protein